MAATGQAAGATATATATVQGVDLLVAEIGSTTTIATAFGAVFEPDGSPPRCLGRGMAPTTVLEGDVLIGLRGALDDLAAELGMPGGGDRELEWRHMLASSSAAGGLRMSVHGLAYDMTVRAAREAALGAGAVVRMVTAGVLKPHELRELEVLRPNIILLAGGVDYGETETAMTNARLIGGLRLAGTPVVFAGNVTARPAVREALEGAGMRVSCVDNVYPRIDELDVEPARRVIQAVFEEHIVHAPGMESIRELVGGRIMPTPAAVMAAAQVLYDSIGDVMVVDVGGATTDVHSVTRGSEEIAAMMTGPEPLAKRTVEGDLGVFVNARNIRAAVPAGALEGALGLPVQEIDRLLAELGPIPTGEDEQRLVVELTRAAAGTAVLRHAGRLRDLYGPGGRTTVAEGKDLTRVRWIVGTGGALTRLPGGAGILGGLRRRRPGAGPGPELLPGPEARILLDRDYVLAPCGVMAHDHPRAALHIMRRSLGLPDDEPGV